MTSHGPLMMDLTGPQLLPEERELLTHPATGGVILFDRNYESPKQAAQLIAEIHTLRTPPLLVAVDQEGGRVQRLKEGFVRLPPASWYGALYKKDPQHAREAAHLVGWLMAAELRTVGVDFSFAPVLDLDHDGLCKAIGDRAFHQQHTVVFELAFAWMQGVHEAGMAAVGKHFPGHGGVCEDSHHELPIDLRDFHAIQTNDLRPFIRMIDAGLEAIMPAHVLYKNISSELAGHSQFWLQKQLRQNLRFQGVIFSDDLNMAAADEAGDYTERATTALNAGCDMILLCNNRPGVEQVLESLTQYQDPAAQMRLVRMHGRKALSRDQLHMDKRWKKALDLISTYDQSSTLSFDL